MSTPNTPSRTGAKDDPSAADSPTRSTADSASVSVRRHSTVPQLDLQTNGRPDPFSLLEAGRQVSTVPEDLQLPSPSSSKVARRESLQATRPPPSPPVSASLHNHSRHPSTDSGPGGGTSSGPRRSSLRQRAIRPPPGPIIPPLRSKRRAQRRVDQVEQKDGEQSTRRRNGGSRMSKRSNRSGRSKASDADSGSDTEVEPSSTRGSQIPMRSRDMADAEQDQCAADEIAAEADDQSLRQELIEDGVHPSSAIWASLNAPRQTSRFSVNSRTSRNSRIHDQQSQSRTSLRDAEEGRGGSLRSISEASHPRPERPRRPTLASAVSYTSTIVVTSIFADIKNDAIAMAGEFVGTILFLITSLGVSDVPTVDPLFQRADI